MSSQQPCMTCEHENGLQVLEKRLEEIEFDDLRKQTGLVLSETSVGEIGNGLL